MKTAAYQTLVTLFTLLPSLNAGELIEVSAVSETSRPDFREMPYTYGVHKVTLNVSKFPIIVTEDIASISIGNDPLIVHADLSAEGLKKMKKGTADLERKQIAIIVDGRVQCAPMLLGAPLGDHFVTEFKDAAEAKAFVDKFKKTGKSVKTSLEGAKTTQRIKPDKTALEDATATQRIKADGEVDGREWTIAQFSDFFDEDITIEKVKKTFGPKPLIESDGDVVTLVYALGSDKIFDHGVRIHTMSVIFKGGHFANVRIGFAHLSD